MLGWLTWWLRPAPERILEDPREELRSLKRRRQALLESLGSLRAYGFDSIAEDDEVALKAVDRRITALLSKRVAGNDDVLLH
ncbi:MAG TPA: hypothetical protein VKW04_16040 [Planctomycetota bacterium]|nr:hypothetical protein [Planctomycetota bacterium]